MWLWDQENTLSDAWPTEVVLGIFAQFGMFPLLLLYDKWLKSKRKHPNLSKENSIWFFGVYQILLLVFPNVQMLCLRSSTDWVQNKHDIAI